MCFPRFESVLPSLRPEGIEFRPRSFRLPFSPCCTASGCLCPLSALGTTCFVGRISLLRLPRSFHCPGSKCFLFVGRDWRNPRRPLCSIPARSRTRHLHRASGSPFHLNPSISPDHPLPPWLLYLVPRGVVHALDHPTWRTRSERENTQQKTCGTTCVQVERPVCSRDALSVHLLQGQDHQALGRRPLRQDPHPQGAPV